MNRFVFLVLLLYAVAFRNVSDANEQQNLCTWWENMARAAMSARQAGVPLRSMLNLVSDETAVSIFRLAYESPKHNGVKDRQTAVSDFADSVVSQCQSE